MCDFVIFYKYVNYCLKYVDYREADITTGCYTGNSALKAPKIGKGN